MNPIGQIGISTNTATDKTIEVMTDNILRICVLDGN